MECVNISKSNIRLLNTGNHYQQKYILILQQYLLIDWRMLLQRNGGYEMFNV